MKKANKYYTLKNISKLNKDYNIKLMFKEKYNTEVYKKIEKHKKGGKENGIL